jgi:hypothetical protein
VGEVGNASLRLARYADDMDGTARRDDTASNING